MAKSKHKKNAKKIKVTRSQVDAARVRLTTDRLLGRDSDPAVEAIASARQVAVQVPGLVPTRLQ